MFLVAFWTQKVATFSWPERPQNINNSTNPQTGPKWPPGASKMTQNHDSDLVRSRKIKANCTVTGSARSALDNHRAIPIRSIRESLGNPQGKPFGHV